jgi:hypothetical protein
MKQILLTTCALLIATVAHAAPIHDAVAARDLARLEQLLKTDAVQANARGKADTTPLHWCVAYNFPEGAKVLLKHKVDIDAQTTGGDTPLHWAAKRNNLAMAILLIDTGANLTVETTQGFTPLHSAAYANAAAVAALLIERDATVDARAKGGLTPLHLAVQKEAFDCMSVLVAHDADIFARTEKGNTAIYWIRTPEARAHFETLIVNRGKGTKPESTTPKRRPKTQPPEALATEGEKLYPDGSRYEGALIAGMPNGQGSMTYAEDKGTYTGEWLDGMRNGNGTQGLGGGESYAGTWSKNQPHGDGT